MARANNKENNIEKTIKVQIVYDNFKNKYTKKVYKLNEVIDVTEKRLNEIRKAEEKSGKTLIKVLEDDAIDTKVDDTNIDKEDNGESIDENVDNTKADKEDNGEETKDAE